MPSNPRLYGGGILVCEGGTGTLTRVDAESGEAEVIAKLPGFARGLAIHDGTRSPGCPARTRAPGCRSRPARERT